MSVQERARSIRSDVTEKRLNHGLEKFERERDRLKVENEVLRDRLARGDEERDRLLGSVDDLASRKSPRRPRKHRMRSLLVLAAAAGSAYMFGAKAGRARYEEIRGRWDGMLERMRQDRSAGSVEPSLTEPPNVAPNTNASVDR
jgi:hypothetical protein